MGHLLCPLLCQSLNQLNPQLEKPQKQLEHLLAYIQLITNSRLYNEDHFELELFRGLVNPIQYCYGTQS